MEEKEERRKSQNKTTKNAIKTNKMWSTFGGLNADGRGAELDGFDGILHLKETALGGESVHSSIVFRTRQKHFYKLVVSNVQKWTKIYSLSPRCGMRVESVQW